MVTTRASPPMPSLFTNPYALTLYTRGLDVGIKFRVRYSGSTCFSVGCSYKAYFFRIICDLTFARAGYHSSVNGNTVIFFAPSCELGHVLTEVLLQVLPWRKKHGPTARIVLCRVDVKDAFRHVFADPERAPAFRYGMGGYAVVEPRFQFGWRNRPRFWMLMASALEHTHTN